MQGAEITFDVIMRADKPKIGSIVFLHPDDAGGLSNPSFKNFPRALGEQEFDPKAERGSASSVVGANLAIGFMDQKLLMPREALKLLDIAFLVDELHSPLFDATPEDVVSRSFIGDNIAGSDSERLLDEPLIAFRRDPFLDVNRFDDNDSSEVGYIQIVASRLQARAFDNVLGDCELITTCELS